ncbi:MAG: HIT family protein [Chloroflexi bacterium]|nr:HIT family protein [Chloroflexota bacterium]MCI0577141.1 HIT family protein [Chloroflexota bacterium]MCI0644681.1 HIT family protein [Chloroflexota bacterium]MCI0730379.1 HIT family protein [Chloroflexota bacterium]
MNAEQRSLDAYCLTCQAQQGFVLLTNAPRILETSHWRVEHAHPTSVRGWLVVALVRHAAALHELTAEEFASLGQLLPILCQALHEIVGSEKEYVMQFAEAAGHSHVHFHVIARLPEWPAELKGAHVFNGLGPKVDDPLLSDVLTPLALTIRQYILARWPAAENLYL